MRKSRRKHLRVVVDTNIIVSGFINKSGSPYLLITKFRENLFELAITNQLLAEYEEVLSRPKLIRWFRISKEGLTAVLRRINKGSTKVIPSDNLPVTIRDPKDEKILAAALGGKADYLVTGDKDLLDLGENPQLGDLKIVTVQEFLKLLE